jgi:hypothetical protein
VNRRDILKALAGIPLVGFLAEPIWERLLVKEFVSRAKPMWGGKLIFWDPFTDKGDDANDGLSSETPVATSERVCVLCSAPRRDWVFTIGQDENGEYYRDLELV